MCAHTLDRWDDIAASIGSIAAQTSPADEIILAVDNNPELVATASTRLPDNVIVVDHRGTRGVSGARNAGVRAAKSDILAFLDDDAVADHNWLEKLLTWYDDPDVTRVGGKAIPVWDPMPGLQWFPDSFLWVIGCTHSGLENVPGEVRNLIGCSMSFRGAAWEDSGGFCESIGRVGANAGGGNETEFCIRVHNLFGGRFIYDPLAIVHHRVPAGQQTFRYFVKRCWAEGKSKASISRQETSGSSLASERAHLVGAIPKEVLTSVAPLARLDFTGLGRAGAVLIGTAVTVGGFLLGRAPQRRPDVAPDFVPRQVQILDSKGQPRWQCQNQLR